MNMNKCEARMTVEIDALDAWSLEEEVGGVNK
jgi:hypothetical protein